MQVTLRTYRSCGLGYPWCSQNAHDKRGWEGHPRWSYAPGTRALRRIDQERSGALLARRVPTVKLWSLDARSEGQPRPLLLVDVRCRGRFRLDVRNGDHTSRRA